MGSSADATSVSTNKSERELIMERVFDAPRELVWQAWTQPEHILQWWGPRTWPTTVSNMDVRPGGTWHYCMTGPGGEQSWGLATYDEVTPPSRLVYTDAFSDADGNVNEDMPRMVITVDFIDADGKTKLISRGRFATEEDLQKVLDMGVVQGMTETWDRLDEHLLAAA